MTPERQAKWADMCDRVNAMSTEEWDRLIALDQCPYEPEHLVGEPIGMHHCPVCGDMVLAGVAHVRRRDVDEAMEVMP